MTEPIFTFRIYANSLYFKVYIWPTKKAMYEAIPGVRRNYAAICRAYDVISGGKKRPIMGEIHFAVNWVTTAIVDHELLHAALAWARRVKLDLGVISTDEAALASKEEEDLCHMHDSFWTQFLEQRAKHQ